MRIRGSRRRKWIAFSSDRNGNLDVFIIPSSGGSAKQLTFHRRTTRCWAGPLTGAAAVQQQSRRRLQGMLYVVSVEGGMPAKAGTDMGLAASFSPDASASLITPRDRFTGASISRRLSNGCVDRRHLDKEVHAVDGFRRPGFVADVEQRRASISSATVTAMA